MMPSGIGPRSFLRSCWPSIVSSQQVSKRVRSNNALVRAVGAWQGCAAGALEILAPAAQVIAVNRPAQYGRLATHMPGHHIPMVFTVLIAACTSGISQTHPFCKINGPLDKVPATIGQLHRGISKAEVDSIFGEQGDMPTPGQYRYLTGGECEYEPGTFGACGFVLEWRRIDRNLNITYLHGLESCSWGGIGE